MKRNLFHQALQKQFLHRTLAAIRAEAVARGDFKPAQISLKQLSCIEMGICRLS